MFFFRFAAGHILALPFLVLALPATAQTLLRYTDHEPLGNMRTTLLREFFDEVQRESKGRLEISAHWNGEISSGYNALSVVGIGEQAELGVIVPEYSDKALPLHQIFKGFLTGPTGANQVRFLRAVYKQVPELGQELGRNNVVPILIATGYPVGFFSASSLNAIGDIKHKRWRTASFWHRDFLNNYGAIPVTMPWSPDVATALGDGRLDGLMVNIDSAVDLNVPESAPNTLASKRLWLGHVYIIGMNRNRWEKLPPSDKKAITRAAEATYRKMGPTMDSSFSKLMAILDSSGRKVRLLESAEVDAFASECQSNQVQDEWAQKQKEQGVASAPSVLNKIRTLWRTAMRSEQ